MSNLKERVVQLLASKQKQKVAVFEKIQRDQELSNIEEERKRKLAKLEADRMQKLIEETGITGYFNDIHEALTAQGQGHNPRWGDKDGQWHSFGLGSGEIDDLGFYYNTNSYKRLELHWGINSIAAMISRNGEVTIQGQEVQKFGLEEWRQSKLVLEEAIFRAFQKPTVYQEYEDTTDWTRGRTPPY